MIGCVLLAGGKSSRMNNVDKTLIEINNKTLLSIIINKLNFDREYPTGKLIITDENNAPIPILSKYQEYAEDDGHIFGLKVPSDFFIDGYFKEWSMLVPVPLNLLSFPKKGRRKIEIRVAFGSNSLNVRLGVPQNKEFLFG